jgi:hypothetical protein
LLELRFRRTVSLPSSRWKESLNWKNASGVL